MFKRKFSWRAIEFAILQTLRFALLGGVLTGMCLALAALPANAAPIQGALPQNPCATFAALQRTPTDTSVVRVQILGVQQGIVGVMILGLPKHLEATVNGIDVKSYLSDTRQIQCGRTVAGELRSYDLRKLPNMDAGYFQIKADKLSAGTSINLR